ncbi:hypothetical protein Tco_0999083 [Tanacetum coccineum]
MGSLVTGSLRAAKELSLISNILGDVILNRLRGGSIVGGGDGDADDGDGGDDYGDDGGDNGGGDGDLPLLRGSASISLPIADSMDGGSVNGARTVFLVQVQPEPVVAYHPPSDPPQKDPPLRTPMGHAQMARTQCPTLVCSLVRLVPQAAQCQHMKPMHNLVMVEPQTAMSQHYNLGRSQAS